MAIIGELLKSRPSKKPTGNAIVPEAEGDDLEAPEPEPTPAPEVRFGPSAPRRGSSAGQGRGDDPGAAERAEEGGVSSLMKLGPNAPTTFEEKQDTATRGFTTGAIQGVGASGGVAGGIKLGALATLAVPVPGARIVGAIVGGVLGYFIGETVVDVLADPDIVGDAPLTFRTLEDVPEALRKFAVLGQTFGSFVGPTGAIVGAGKMGVRIIIDPTAGRLKQFAGNLINGMFDQAANRTGRFIATEVGAASSAAIAGSVAESVFPGEAGVRFGAEFLGGLLSPVRLIAGLGVDATRATIAFFKTINPQSRLDKTGRLLQQYIEGAGGDPQKLIIALQNFRMPDGTRPTVAMALGDDIASALEAEMRVIDLPFAGQSQSAARASLDALAVLVVMLKDMGRAGGSMAALTEAARLRDTAYRTLLQANINRAQEKAINSAKTIAGDVDKSRSALSLEAERTLSESMKMGRQLENQLWSQVKPIPASANRVVRMLNKLKAQMLDRASLPKLLEDTVADIQAAGALERNLRRNGLELAQVVEDATSKVASSVQRTFARAVLRKMGVTLGQVKAAAKTLSTEGLQKFRAEALEQAREADKAGKSQLARRLGLLAEAALDDIDSAFEKGLKNGSKLSAAYASARGYTHQFHETYTRAFGGVTREKGRRGQDLVPPEVLLHDALATGPEMRALRFKELEMATRFMFDLTDDAVQVPEAMLRATRMNVEKMLDAQESFIRLAAAEVVDPTTGLVNIGTLKKFLSGNEELLARFEPVQELLANALKSEEARRTLENATKSRLARIAKHNAFAKVLKVESAADAVGAAMNSANPVQEMTAIWNLARRGGAEAQAGFRIAFWEHVAGVALRNDGKGVSLPKLIETVDLPMRPGLPSALEMAAKQGWMRKSEIEQVKKFLELGRNIIRSQAVGPSGEMIFGGGMEDLTGAAADLLLRVVGAKAGRAVAGLAPGKGMDAGTSLISSYAGSRLMRQVFVRLPKLGLVRIATGALRGDPLAPGGEPYSLMIALLEAPPDPKAAIRLSQQVHAYAIGASLNFTSESVDVSIPSFADDDEEAADLEARPAPELRTELEDPFQSVGEAEAADGSLGENEQDIGGIAEGEPVDRGRGTGDIIEPDEGAGAPATQLPSDAEGATLIPEVEPDPKARPPFEDEVGALQVKEGVDLSELKPEALAAAHKARLIVETLGEEFVITSTGEEADGRLDTSKHFLNQAFDMRVRGMSQAKRKKITAELKESLGEEYDVVLKTDPPHIHIEFDPEGSRQPPKPRRRPSTADAL